MSDNRSSLADPVQVEVAGDLEQTLFEVKRVIVGQDRVLELPPTDTGWRVEAEVVVDHDWNVRLGPADGQWRLQGRLPGGQQAASLRPALQAP